MYLAIGLMSGTSMDGIDAALLETDGDSHIIEHGHYALPYDAAFKTLLHAAQYTIRTHRGDLTLASKQFEVHGLTQYLSVHLGLSEPQFYAIQESCYQYMDTAYLTLPAIFAHSTALHAKAVQALLQTYHHQPQDIKVIGYHGQTMYHQPHEKVSVIIGDGHALAEHTGIAVVNDFRREDLRLGGQGAPFAPMYHQALAKRDNLIPAAVVNCGGIANITFISNTTSDDLVGFDTGPGNGLLDRLVQQRTHGQEQMDKDGQYGLQGKVDDTALAALYRDAIAYQGRDFFKTPPCKALDIGDLRLVPELERLSLPDACATLAAFTADTIVRSLDHINTLTIPDIWILAGGGWFNPVIKQQLAERLQQKLGRAVKLVTADDIGWHCQALEAQLFAYFAIRSLQGKPLSVPGTTGVRRPVSGGQLHLPANQQSANTVLLR